MYDSLKNDPSTGLSGSVIWGHIDSTVLEVGLAYGSTYKHTIRSDPNQLTAYVRREGERSGQRFASIKYWAATRPRLYIEALDLAEQ